MIQTELRRRQTEIFKLPFLHQLHVLGSRIYQLLFKNFLCFDGIEAWAEVTFASSEYIAGYISCAIIRRCFALHGKRDPILILCGKFFRRSEAPAREDWRQLLSHSEL